ncbi:hypothetical protein QMO56_15965 [Roseomonas sp. E05]|uniref:hypothetical protein n=1 Tax=Roseomonas sp. E05 TaxID=3046310 RepID=UPI0024BA6D07|nr:hypothetical protein [Roseomonas sp. E05]MDJ0389613.1 hypothetical protein [Roseomonas sp. E05]
MLHALRAAAPLLLAACGTVPAAYPLRLAPQQDVAVTYRLSGAQGALMRRSWLAAEARLRVEFGPVPGRAGYTILDGRGKRAFMVSDVARTVTVLPWPSEAGLQDPALRADARFLREGQERIAGAPCILWRIEPPGAPPVRACITADGVLLRSETEIEGHRLAREAIELRYGPQEPARFHPPEGYAVIDLTTGLPAHRL